MRKIKQSTKIIPLSSLKNGQQAEITFFTPDSAVQMRLQEMGFVPGEKITKIKTAPLGDPGEFQIMGYNLCLRQHEAALIPVTVLP
jgi:ferrous iron transport protein B